MAQRSNCSPACNVNLPRQMVNCEFRSLRTRTRVFQRHLLMVPSANATFLGIPRGIHRNYSACTSFYKCPAIGNEHSLINRVDNANPMLKSRSEIPEAALHDVMKPPSHVTSATQQPADPVGCSCSRSNSSLLEIGHNTK